MELSLLLFEG